MKLREPIPLHDLRIRNIKLEHLGPIRTFVFLTEYVLLSKLLLQLSTVFLPGSGQPKRLELEITCEISLLWTDKRSRCFLWQAALKPTILIGCLNLLRKSRQSKFTCNLYASECWKLKRENSHWKKKMSFTFIYFPPLVIRPLNLETKLL